jgi:hypothetical protein
MHQVTWFRRAVWLLLVLGLVIATPRPSGAQILNDSEEPGSLIVFPKFISGQTAGGDPRSEFEISVVCPPGFKDPNTGTGCLPPYGEGFRIKIRAHWVCPGAQDINKKFICRETDFDLFTTVFGTVAFNPANVGAGAFPVASGSAATGINAPPTVFSPTVTAQRVPAPPCPQGYLIAWVVNANDQPIKFDALIGDAVIRDPDTGAPSAYNATPIQAAPGLAPGAPIPFPAGPGALALTGTAYQAVPGLVEAPVRFAQAAAGPPPCTAVQTDLTLLTLDVDSNAPNLPTFVELDFYNANEVIFSTFTEFICWTEVSLTEIDPNLTVDGTTTRKGLVVSGPAQKFDFVGITNQEASNNVTILGLVTTTVTQTPAVGPSSSFSYTYQMFNDSTPVPTNFAFKPQAGAPQAGAVGCNVCEPE